MSVEAETSLDEETVSVLFVCTANVCRSPTAHGVFEDFLKRVGYSDFIHVDSAGTKAQHSGKPPEARAQKIAVRAGYDISNLVARPLMAADFDKFNYIIAMDGSHLDRIEEMRPDSYEGHTARLMEFADDNCSVLDIPDPYYGSTNDFVVALDLIEQGNIGLLEYIVNKHYHRDTSEKNRLPPIALGIQ